MTDPVKSIEVFSLTTERREPYLGSLRPGEEPNDRGYFVRRGNRTVYPVFDRSVLVRVETESGVAGWGETYGLVAPGAVGEIINDLLAGFTVGRDASDPAAIHDDLYDLMRVRGYTGGFLGDALAAIDIALWDIAGKEAGCSVAKLLQHRAGRSGMPFRPTIRACPGLHATNAPNSHERGRGAALTPSSSRLLFWMAAPRKKCAA